MAKAMKNYSKIMISLPIKLYHNGGIYGRDGINRYC